MEIRIEISQKTFARNAFVCFMEKNNAIDTYNRGDEAVYAICEEITEVTKKQKEIMERLLKDLYLVINIDKEGNVTVQIDTDENYMEG